MSVRSANFRTYLIGSTAVFALCAGAASAQESNGDIEQVVVSASRVTIAGYSQPTPVTVIGVAQLEQEAYANISDSVRQLPQVSAPPTSFSTSQASGSTGTAGANFINLRDLGTTRTLVLFDSQRMVPANLTGGVDITLLPSAVIERVDIVTGGASAAWGSDAIAGVANFILNKNVTGFKASIEGSDTTNGLRRGLSGNGVWGEDILGGRGHIEFAGSVNILPDTVLDTDEKWFNGAYWVSNPAYAAGNGKPQLIVANNVGLAGATVGGLITASPAGVAGPGVSPAAVNALRGIQFTGAGIASIANFGNVSLNTLSNGGSLTDRDAQPGVALIANPSSTYTFFGYGRYKLTDTIQASAQFNYGYFTGKGDNPPPVQTAITIRSDNAYIPASVRSAMQNGGIQSFTLGSLGVNNVNTFGLTGGNYYSQAEGSLGSGVQFDRRNAYRGVFTLDGTIGDDWSWNAYIQHSATRLSYNFLADPITANLAAAEDAITVTSANVGKSGLALGSVACRNTVMGTGSGATAVTAQSGCVPLNVFGNGVASPAAIAYVDGYAAGTYDYAHQSVQEDAMEGSMQGTLPWQLPAGKVAVAFGVGYRKESGVESASPIAQISGWVQSDNTNFPGNSYNVIEGFGEVDAPILKNNIVNSLDINMAGRMTSYSTSGLVETWKIGATSQINDDIKLRVLNSIDIRAPGLNELFSLGSIGVKAERDPKTQATVTANTVTPGNPNLVPEVARTYSGGVVLTPTFIPGLSLSADWYSIKISGVITSLTDSQVTTQCNSTLPSLIYPGTSGNPSDPLCSRLIFNGAGGSLSQINLSFANFNSQTTSGLDLQANYTMDFWGGTLNWVTTDNYTDEDTVIQPGVGYNDYAGANDLAPSSAGIYAPGPKWRGILSSTYTTGPYAFTVQTRWFGHSISYRNGNQGDQSSAAAANLYDPAHWGVPAIAYLDLRANYKWNDNISFFGAVDNALNLPPPLVAPVSTSTSLGSLAFYDTNQSIFDMMGRVVRVGVRLNY